MTASETGSRFIVTFHLRPQSRYAQSIPHHHSECSPQFAAMRAAQLGELSTREVLAANRVNRARQLLQKDG